LTDERGFNDIDAIFHRAVGLEKKDRLPYLDQVCADRPELRREIELLLEADAEPDSILDRPVINRSLIDSLASTTPDSLQPERESESARPVARNHRAVKQIPCGNGHYYSPADHLACPHCGVAGLARGKRIPPNPPQGLVPGFMPGRVHQQQPIHKERAAALTRNAVFPGVGWLACIDGADRGCDFRIRAQRNFIGREHRMDICISGDENVSRVNHAVLTYDAGSNLFRVAPCEPRKITYLNQRPVETPMTLKPYDILALGALRTTRLIFVPLCGEAFQWK